MIVDYQSTVYHAMSRIALDGFPSSDIENDFRLDLIRRYAALYLVEILGFCLMRKHFHILVRVIPEYNFTEEDIKNAMWIFTVMSASLPMVWCRHCG